MTELSPRLALPLLHAGQAQKELFVNEALTIADAKPMGGNEPYRDIAAFPVDAAAVTSVPRLKLAPQLPRVMADTVQVGQVLVRISRTRQCVLSSTPARIACGQ